MGLVRLAASRGVRGGGREHCHGMMGNFPTALFGPANRVSGTMMLAQPSLSVGVQGTLD